MDERINHAGRLVPGSPERRAAAVLGRCSVDRRLRPGGVGSTCRDRGRPAVRLGPPVLAPKSRVVAAVLAIVLGGLGAHKFYLGKTQAGLIHVGMTLVGICGAVLLLPLLLLIASYFIAIAEGVIYLTKTDEQFEAIYVRGDKSWF